MEFVELSLFSYSFVLFVSFVVKKTNATEPPAAGMGNSQFEKGGQGGFIFTYKDYI